MIASRLTARKRESELEIAERLRRRDDLASPPDGVVEIDNSGAMELAGTALLALVGRPVGMPATPTAG